MNLNGYLTLLTVIATTTSAQVFTVTQYPSICSAIYTSGTASVTIVQSTITSTVPIPYTDSSINSGAVDFVLEFDSPAGSKRQAAQASYLQANGTTTSDASKAVRFVIQDGQLRSRDGQYISTSPDIDNQTMALSSVELPINTVFASVNGVLTWLNPAFANNGMAQYFRTPVAGQPGSSQIFVYFRGRTATSWAPAEAKARPAAEVISSNSAPSMTYTVVSTSIFSNGVPDLPQGTTSQSSYTSSGASSALPNYSEQPIASISSGMTSMPGASSSAVSTSTSLWDTKTLSTVTAPGDPIGPNRPSIYTFDSSSQSSLASGQLVSASSPSLTASTLSSAISSSSSGALSVGASSGTSSSSRLSVAPPVVYSESTGSVSSALFTVSFSDVASEFSVPATSILVSSTSLTVSGSSSGTTSPDLSSSGSDSLASSAQPSFSASQPTSSIATSSLLSISTSSASDPPVFYSVTSSVAPLSTSTSIAANVATSTSPSASTLAQQSSSSVLASTSSSSAFSSLTTSSVAPLASSPSSILSSSSSILATSSTSFSSTSSQTSSASSTSSGYLVLASPTPCDFGDPVGTDQDDSFCEIDLPSSMRMYSTSSTTTFASTNGFISLINGSSQYEIGRLPYSAIPNSTVLPLMEDLFAFGSASPRQGIFYQADTTAVTYEYYIGAVGYPTAIYHFTVGYVFASPGIFTFTYYDVGNGINGNTSSVGTQGLDSAGDPIATQYSYETASILPGMVLVCDTNQNSCTRTQ